MNAPRHEIEARRVKMRTIDRATEQLLSFEFPLSTRAVEDMRGLLRTMWPLFAADVIESKELAAKLTFEVVLAVKNGEPRISVEAISNGEPKAAEGGGAGEAGIMSQTEKTPKSAEAFYRELLEQIAADPRRTRARRLAESGLLFWDSMREEADRVSMQNTEATQRDQ